MSSKEIAIAYGDGIGPEIMEATLKILKESEAKISVQAVSIGKKFYEQGYNSGISQEAWDIIKRTKILLKGPITTPQGGGYKSLNVTLRKTLGLFVNVRPCTAFHPYIKTHHPDMDIVIIRENEEDLYAGIEYRQTHNSYQTLKLISETGSRKVIRYAFEYAVKNNRKKVSCLSKDNIMKFTDGIFHKVFDEVSKEYPSIKSDHYIIDIGTAKIANNPEIFDVIVTSNLYGDIISDVAAEISGSVGLAGSANIGSEFAMFEAIHGSAPDIADKNIANPSGLINAAILMLVHIGEVESASKIHNALLRTIEDGFHSKDIFDPKISKKLCSTSEFADEIIVRLGQKPVKMKEIYYEKFPEGKNISFGKIEINYKETKNLVGVDVFIDWRKQLKDLVDMIENLQTERLKLQMISVKGLTIWPGNEAMSPYDDNWRLRFLGNSAAKIEHNDIVKLLSIFNEKNIDFIKTENLYNFDGKPGYSLGQGE